MKKVILLAAAIMIALLSTTYLYAEEPSPVKEILIKPPVMKSQFFCGYCHILTYPRVMKKAQESWKIGKHKEISCEECHYPPDRIKIAEHRRIPEDEKKKTDMEFMRTELEGVNSKNKTKARRPQLHNI